jgi:hypothetical protein
LPSSTGRAGGVRIYGKSQAADQQTAEEAQRLVHQSVPNVQVASWQVANPSMEGSSPDRELALPGPSDGAGCSGECPW